MKFYRKSREGSGLKRSSFSMLQQGESNINFYTAILYIIQCVPKQPASFFSKASSNFTGIKWANIFIKPRLIPHHLASKFSKSIHWFRSNLNFNSAGRFSRFIASGVSLASLRLARPPQNSVSRLVVGFHGEKIIISGTIKKFRKRIRNAVEVDGCLIGRCFNPMASEGTANWEKTDFLLGDTLSWEPLDWFSIFWTVK